MNNEEIINVSALRALISSRGRILREKNQVPFETAKEAFITLAEIVHPGYKIDDANKFAIENLLRWLISDPGALCDAPGGGHISADLQKGIYLQGGVGTGKSLLLDLARTICQYFHIKITADDSVIPMAWRTYRADDICDIYCQDGDLRRWKVEQVLCIQDFGSEPGESTYMGNRRRVAGSIVEARGDMYDRLTLFSSNIPIHKVGDIYGLRVQSRLYSMCNILTLYGPDRRK